MDCSFAAPNSVNCLNESIKTLTNLAGSPLRSENSSATAAVVQLRRNSERCLTTSEAKSLSVRISMANLEETQESELDVILGELSLLEAQINCGDAAFLPGVAQTQQQSGYVAGAGNGIAGVGVNNNNNTTTTCVSSCSGSNSSNNGVGVGVVGGCNSSTAGTTTTTATPPTRTHSRTNSSISGATTLSISAASDIGSVTTHSSSSSAGSENGLSSGISSSSSSVVGGVVVGVVSGVSNAAVVANREPRTESPDNDSAFSDTVSLLSSESSASSSASSAHHHKQLQLQQQQQLLEQQQKQIQLQYMQQQLSIATLNSTKAAKIQLALAKLESASIRRLFVKAFTSDGASKSLLVDERMTCGHVTRLLADKNHVRMQPYYALVENLGDLQMERLFEDHELLVDNLMTWNSDAGNRVLFQQRSDKVALFIKPEVYLPGPQMTPGTQHDDNTRTMLLEEFFETNSQLQVDGPLYMKPDSKKAWKRYHFVLRSSGLYYFPKEKTKNTRDLACLTLFNGYNVYKGIGWKKKWKAPTDYTFGFKSAVDSSLGKTCRTLKMLCAEDLETMEKWVTAIRISKYGKQLWEQHKTLMEDLTLHDGNSHNRFVPSMRSDSISSISSSVPSQCGSVSSAISSISNSSSGRISRASSSSSSGCMSDDNNGFEAEFTTGTIKRKPHTKPNLPLTTMTRQLMEVGETLINDSSSGDAIIHDLTEISGTLTRRHTRRKSQESNGSSGTLKRRQHSAASVKRGSAESMNASSGSSNSTPTPTPSICATPLLEYDAAALSNNVVPPPINQSCMNSSTLSLDSLPPPPPPAQVTDEHEIYGSQMSLSSLPPPPPPEEVDGYMPQRHLTVSVAPVAATVPNHPYTNVKTNGIYTSVTPPAVPMKPIKPAVKAAPPYKAPPEYVGQVSNLAALPPPPPVTQKKVSFADSPVLLRRRMCSPEPRTTATPLPALINSKQSQQQQQQQQHFHMSAVPQLPPRTDVTRLSTASSSVSTQDFGSPKRLQESTSNPPRDFLKDLQRVMRKKWQVAQKCKDEPATTPHEVLGFRDFNDELAAHNLSTAGGYYRETANVSNWVQEHYGAGAPIPLAPTLNEYALYENMHTGGNTVDAIVEPQFPIAGVGVGVLGNAVLAVQRKKRPPPPPPKRSDSTHLTHRV